MSGQAAGCNGIFCRLDDGDEKSLILVTQLYNGENEEGRPGRGGRGRGKISSQ